MTWLTILQTFDEQQSIRARDLPDDLPRSFQKWLGWDHTPDLPLPVSLLRRMAVSWQVGERRPTVVLSPRIGQEAFSLATFWARHLGMTRSALAWSCLHGNLPSATPASNRIAMLCFERLRTWAPSEQLDFVLRNLSHPETLKKIPILEGSHISMRITPDQKMALEQRSGNQSVSAMFRESLERLARMPLIKRVSPEKTRQLIDLQWQVSTQLGEGKALGPDWVYRRLLEILGRVA